MRYFWYIPEDVKIPRLCRAFFVDLARQRAKNNTGAEPFSAPVFGAISSIFHKGGAHIEGPAAAAALLVPEGEFDIDGILAAAEPLIQSELLHVGAGADESGLAQQLVRDGLFFSRGTLGVAPLRLEMSDAVLMSVLS